MGDVPCRAQRELEAGGLFLLTQNFSAGASTLHTSAGGQHGRDEDRRRSHVLCESESSGAQRWKVTRANEAMSERSSERSSERDRAMPLASGVPPSRLLDVTLELPLALVEVLLGLLLRLACLPVRTALRPAAGGVLFELEATGGVGVL